MKAKQYLEQIKWLDIKINDKISERESYWSLATKVTPTLSHAPAGSGVSDKVGNIVAKIVAIDEQINEQIDEFVDLKIKITNEIEQVNDRRYHDLLYKKYVEYKDFAVIAGEMCYEYTSILNMHGKALKAFEKVMIKSDIHQ